MKQKRSCAPSIVPCLLALGIATACMPLAAEQMVVETILANTNFKAPEGSGQIDFDKKKITANGKVMPLIKKESKDRIDLSFDDKQEGGTLKLTMDGHTQTVPLRPAGIDLFDQGLGALDINDTCVVLNCADPDNGFTGKPLRGWVGSQSEHGFAFTYHIVQVTNTHYLMRMESKGNDGGAQVAQKFEWFLTKPGK